MNSKTKILLFGGIFLAILVVLIVRNRSALNSATVGSNMATAHSVTVVPASREIPNERIALVGTIFAFNDVTVLSETQGRVLKINAEVGDYKPAGAVLVEVDSELKEAAFKVAEVNYEKAKKDVARYESLFNEHSISDTQIEQARWTFQSAEAQFVTARRQLSDTKITTPIAGVVTARYVNVGTMVMGAPQATPIANVVDLSKLKAKVSVAEQDVFSLHVGDQVEVLTDVFPGKPFAGSIYTISSKGDDGHTYPVEVLVKDPQQQLKAGMFAHLTFTPKRSEELLLVPRVAIIGSMQAPKVFVVNNNQALLRSVIAVREIGTNVAISSGIQAGDSVVVDGQNDLSDNAPVIVRQH